MRLVTLLLDPRGVIGRRAYWAGLGLLTATLVVALLMIAVLARWAPVGGVAMAVGPVIGTSFLVAEIVEAVTDRRASLHQVPVVLLLCCRLYPLACLCLKRLRDAGRGPISLVVVSAVSLAFHVIMGRWSYDLWESEMGTLIPLALGMAVNALLWTIFLVWTGAVRTRPPQVKPAS